MGRRMTKIKLKFIKEYRRNGETYRYFRRKGCAAIRIPGEPGSREFNEAYQVALNEKPLPASKHGAGTIGHLIMDYYGSADFKNLKPRSRKAYRIVLEPITREHGHRLVRDMGRGNARKIIETIGATRPGMANLTRSVLIKLMEFAVACEYRNDNPVKGIKTYKMGTRHTWTEEQLTAYETRWPVGTRERLVYASLLYSGQRGGDVIRMLRPDKRAATIKVIQEKTGAELTLPIHPVWRKIINATPAKGLSLLGNERGQPITRDTLTRWINDAASAAKLPPECKAHGLRKAMARRLAEAGSSAKEIAAITGHKTLEEIERYTAMADQARLAEQAMSNIGRIRQSAKRK